jgi:hypothetical protein
MANIYLFIELLRIADAEVVAKHVRSLPLEKCQFANVVVLNDRKLVAQLDCPDPTDGDKAILTKIATVQGVVQTNVISVIRPVRP